MVDVIIITQVWQGGHHTAQATSDVADYTRGLSISDAPGGARGSPARWDFVEAGYCNRHDVRCRLRRSGCVSVSGCRLVGAGTIAKHLGSLPRGSDRAVSM